MAIVRTGGNTEGNWSGQCTMLLGSIVADVPLPVCSTTVVTACCRRVLRNAADADVNFAFGTLKSIVKGVGAGGSRGAGRVVKGSPRWGL